MNSTGTMIRSGVATRRSEGLNAGRMKAYSSYRITGAEMPEPTTTASTPTEQKS